MVSNNSFPRQLILESKYLFALIFLVLISVSTILIIQLVEDKYQQQVHASINAVFHSTVESIEHFQEAKKRKVETLASITEIKEKTQLLLRMQQNGENIIGSNTLDQLRRNMKTTISNEAVRGFFIISPQGINIASARNSNIGQSNLLTKYPKIFDDALKGKTVFSPVTQSDVNLTNPNDPLPQKNNQSLFVITPITNQGGNIIALLTLRLDPNETLFKLVSAGLGETGETYLFDQKGWMLSKSRFAKKNDALGLGVHDTLFSGGLLLRDPGRLLTPEHPLQKEEMTDLLTLAVTSATINRLQDSNIEGYRDYRGKPVIGKWRWFDNLHLGMVTEQNVDDAYDFFYFLRSMIVFSTLIITSIFMALAWFLFQNIRLKRENQKRLGSIIDTAVDGILLVNADGKIELTNPALAELFGYPEKDMIGMDLYDTFTNINQALQYQNSLQDMSTSSGSIFEFERRNGARFPGVLSVNSFVLSDGLHFAMMIRDVTEEIASRNQLRTTSLVAHATQYAVIVADAKAEIKWVNEGFERLLGYSLEEVIGKKPKSFLQGKNSSKETSKKIGQALKSREFYKGEIINYAKDGTELWLEIEINPIFDENGELVEFVALEQDITEKRKLSSALEKEKHLAEMAKQEAINANQAKSSFLAAMTHEIRTPLNGIVGTIDMLALSEVNRSQRDLIKTAKDSAELLLTVIDDILDFSKIEAEKLVLEELPISVENEMETVADNLSQLAQKNDVEFTIFCDPDIPSILSDPNRFKQILFNLTGNAIKFSKDLPDRQGKVYLSIESLTDLEGDQHLCINVKDNGIGMSDTVVSRLFKSFSQGEDTTTRRFGGTGLGLVITKKLVEAMHGRISVESSKDKGSLFQVLLPMKRIEQDIRSNTSDLSGIDVILVNPQDTASKIIKTYLESANANCKLVTEAYQILETIEKSSHAPIVVITLDSESSYQVRELINQTPTNRAVRYLQIERGRRRYARTIDNNTFSFDLDVMHRNRLLNSVAALVGRESPETQPAIDEHLLRPVDSDNEQKPIALIVDDNDINQMVIGQQLSILGYAFEVADDGQQALDKILAKNFKYDVILTDCHMPVMDGYELAAAIREQETEEQHLPIIAITADALKGTKERCYEAGMDDYITKPIPIEELKWKIIDVVGNNNG